jgi:2-keto-4-pentenoate hydratase
MPRDLAEAYRLQAAVTSELGAIGGWKVAAVTAAQRETLAVDAAIGAPLLQPWLHDVRRRAAELRVADFIAPKLECEFAFELARDLPPRPGQPYTRKEVAEAMLAMRIAVEIVDSRLPRGLGALAELSDGFNNGAFIGGPRIHAWHGLDFAALAIVLTRAESQTSEEIARGSGAAILDGDPFGTVVQLANAPPASTRGLLAGDIVTTGSCTGAPRLPGAGAYRADFGALGSVEFRFVA